MAGIGVAVGGGLLALDVGRVVGLGTVVGLCRESAVARKEGRQQLTLARWMRATSAWVMGFPPVLVLVLLVLEDMIA